MDEWLLNELFEIEKMDTHSFTELVLYLNACFENMRRKGLTYEEIKKMAIEQDKKMK